MFRNLFFCCTATLLLMLVTQCLGNDNATGTASVAAHPTIVSTNSSSSCAGNVTDCEKESDASGGVFTKPLKTLYENKEMLLRTFYVLMAVTAIVIVYFVVKNVMLRRNKSKSKKYGIISTPASDLEMQPLDQGDDDDDMTLYEARSSKLK